jgi:hypothetical protein
VKGLKLEHVGSIPQVELVLRLPEENDGLCRLLCAHRLRPASPSGGVKVKRNTPEPIAEPAQAASGLLL